MSLKHPAIALLVLGLSPLAAQAQDPAASPAIGLQVDGGTILVSDGADFVQATSGQTLQPGQRVMVPEGASASLNYSGGCQTALGQPGVYTVSATCNVAGSQSAGESTTANAGAGTTTSPGTAGGAAASGAGAAGGTGAAIGTGTIVAGVVGGVAVIAAAAGGGGSDDPPAPPPPPISR